MELIICILLAYSCFGPHLDFNFNLKNLVVTIRISPLCTFVAFILYCISTYLK